jgi:hypothetical protein
VVENLTSKLFYSHFFGFLEGEITLLRDRILLKILPSPIALERSRIHSSPGSFPFPGNPQDLNRPINHHIRMLQDLFNNYLIQIAYPFK